MKAAAVDYIAQTHHRNSGDKINSPPFGLPLVSVIIVNYNYGRFLKQAANSVFEQTYPNIECIIVDNASTDESADVLLAISKQYPGTTILRRSDNGGQSLATIEGFEESSGEYVVFLDADDVLLPSCVETHIFVHLSLRIPVGFTSADMIQSVGSRMVLGTIYGLSEYARSGRGVTPSLVRRIDETASEVWPLRSPGAELESQVHLVQPGDIGIWVWAPTSGNCFRRDALQLFLMKESLRELRSCTDAYLIRGISVLMGSVVIDRSLGIYRLHGMNVFSKHPNLYCMLHYERGGPSDNDLLGRKLVIDHLIANVGLFLHKLESTQAYMRALKALDDTWPRIPSTVGGCRSYLAGKLVSESATLAGELGAFNFVGLLIRLKVAPHVILLACLRGKPKSECEPHPAASMEVICLDNGLISKGEHSYNLAVKLTGTLSRRNLRSRIFGVQAMDQSIVEELGAVAHFKRSLYESMGSWYGEKQLRSVAAVFRGGRASGPSRSERNTWKALNQAFEKDLVALPADVWKFNNLVIVPAISQNQILGLIRYLLREPRERLPRVVCHLMFPPTWTPWGASCKAWGTILPGHLSLGGSAARSRSFLYGGKQSDAGIIEAGLRYRRRNLADSFRRFASQGNRRRHGALGIFRLLEMRKGLSSLAQGNRALPAPTARCRIHYSNSTQRMGTTNDRGGTCLAHAKKCAARGRGSDRCRICRVDEPDRRDAFAL